MNMKNVDWFQGTVTKGGMSFIASTFSLLINAPFCQQIDHNIGWWNE